MHDHPISHLSDIDRRTFLRTSGLAMGSLFLSGLFPSEAISAPTVSLPGFAAFAEKVKVFKNSKYYLIESDGLPDHGMMVGIKSWQQQIPTPHPYSGTNAWSVPITPVISKTPISAKNHFLRGAIAIAVNGVPIFNALNNRGDDAYLAGELDDWGGHCGRADDYHYHVAPFHLQAIVGTKVPIAYALDGFPIYGEKEIDGKKVTGLDEFNGHFDSKKKYHYHGTKGFPYINGGFKGIVSEIDGQVSPQAATKGFRPAGTPLRGASITGFTRLAPESYMLEYTLNSQVYQIEYKANLSNVEMNFKNPDGSIRREVYTRK
ncbi:MAG: YHYH protein [Actinobacteria bacterium]|nr:YHYH protein [Actinomycetota bacterium]